MRRTLLATLLCLGWLAARASASPIGTVLDMSGPATDNGRALARGAQVQVGDTIATSATGQVKLQMADGTVITLAAGSSLRIAGYDVRNGGRQVSMTLSEGLMRAVVPPANGSSFVVSTPGSMSTVRSDTADWFVSAELGGAQCGVLSGRVEMTSAGTGRSVVIPAHWGTRQEGGRDPVLPRTWGQMEFVGFLRRTACCQPGSQ